MADEPISDPPPAAALPPPLPPPPAPMRPRRERLPGTYAGNYLDIDPNPTAGGVITGVLFAAAFVFEVLHLLTEVFGGLTFNADAYACIRVGLFSLGLIMLWVGVDWARWVLAIGALLFGGGLLGNTLTMGRDALARVPYAAASVPLGFIYLGIFAYLFFSPNVAAFARRQRIPGKSYSVAPVVLLGAGCVALLIATRFLADEWHKAEQQSALAFGDDSLRALSEHWDPQVFDQRADADYVAQWPVEAKKAVLHDFSRVGAVRKINHQTINILGYLEMDRGFHWRGYYAGEGGFEHGNARMTFELERGVFSPWRITALTLSPLMDNSPAAVPAPAKSAP